MVLMETVKFFRMTSDEAPEPALLALGFSGNSFQGGGGKNSAPLALLRKPALRPVLNLIQDLFQGRLLWPVLALGGLLLNSCLPKGFGADLRPLPLPAICEIKVKANPRVGETVKASFSITPKEDLKRIKVVVKGSGVEILGGEKIKKNGVLTDTWVKVLAGRVNLKHGLTRCYSFRIRFLESSKLPIELFVEAGIPSGNPSGWFSESVMTGQTWVLADEQTGELKPFGESKNIPR